MQIDSPLYTNDAYAVMEPRWYMTRSLYRGTEAIREDPEPFVVQSPAEGNEEFAARVNSTELFPAFQRTIDGLTGIVFRIEPSLQEDVPTPIKDHWENIDGMGSHGAVFAKEAFRDGLTYGHVAILVDAPVVPAGQRLTAGQEQRLGVRPYWVRILPEDILSWRTMKRDGRLQLQQVVIREYSQEADGFFADVTVERYKLIWVDELGVVNWRVWSYDRLESWTSDTFDDPDDEGVFANQTEIPLVLIYCGVREAPLVSRPGLLDLAYMNVAHLNVMSDRRVGLKSALHPILVFKGRRVPKATNTGRGQEEAEILVGPNIGIDLPGSPDADAFYVEHAGKALGEGRMELQDIEKRMAVLGLSMLQAETRAAETAESKRIDRDEKQGNLASAARSLQDGIEMALAFHANYLRLDTGGSVSVNRKFESQPLSPQTVDSYSKMVAAGQLSLETMWSIFKSHEFLPTDMDEALEMSRVLAAGEAVAEQENDIVNSGGEVPPDEEEE